MKGALFVWAWIMEVAIVAMHDDMERIIFVGRKRVQKRMVLSCTCGTTLVPMFLLLL